MVADKRSWHDMEPEEQYALFLNALAGIADDAGINGYSREGTDYLARALQTFRAEYYERHGEQSR